jgi:hypothetical protein
MDYLFEPRYSPIATATVLLVGAFLGCVLGYTLRMFKETR